MARPPFQPRKPQGPRINDQITAEKVRLVGADGEMLGVSSLSEAIEAAENAGLDLVEISPNADPPVCKILDYGKYKYEQQKKANEARKKQKTVEVKEIKMRPTTEVHDYNVKLRNAQRFLKDENKVKVTLRFRGREMAHKDLAMNMLNRFRDDLADLSKVELSPKMEGRQMIMVLSPDATAVEKPKIKPPKDKDIESKTGTEEESSTGEAAVDRA